MALINCPECGVKVSDKAFQCPKCAYPISNYVQPKQNVINEQTKPKNTFVNTEPYNANINEMLLLSNKKSEGFAILLVLIFGPFGLFYANASKAVKLIISMIAIMVFLAFFNSQMSEDKYLNFCVADIVVFWLISLTQASDSVKKYNLSLLATTPKKPNTTSYDTIDELYGLINKEKEIPFYAPNKKEDILIFLDKLCIDKESTIYLMNEYGSRYNQNLIKELISLTSNKQTIKQYIAHFEEYGIIDPSLHG